MIKCCFSFVSRLIDSLRDKCETTRKDFDSFEIQEREIENLRFELKEARERANNLYVYDADQDSTEIALNELSTHLNELVDKAKQLSHNTKTHYLTIQQLVPSDLNQQLTGLELSAEATAQAMEEKQREQKRARTVRSDYLSDVDEVQAWVRQAEINVQDRSLEPTVLRENLREIQNELGPIGDKLERLTKNGRAIIENTKDDKEKELIDATINNLTEQFEQVKSWLELKKQQLGDTMDAWQRFLTLYETVKTWNADKKQFLADPLRLKCLVQARQRLHDYSVSFPLLCIP